MKYTNILNQEYLYFSAWCKKGYSIFCSLGREVKIARLAIHMYQSVLLKCSLKGLIIVNTDHTIPLFLLLTELSGGEEVIKLAQGEVCPDRSNIIQQRKDMLPR